MIDQRCCECHRHRVYENYRTKKYNLLTGEGWKKIKDRWICPDCVIGIIHDNPELMGEKK